MALEVESSIGFELLSEIRLKQKSTNRIILLQFIQFDTRTCKCDNFHTLNENNVIAVITMVTNKRKAPQCKSESFAKALAGVHHL